jgi:ParB-like chromosome segregation protein Spo0J
MSQPPLKPLHPESSLSQPKLAQFRRLTTEELIASLKPGQAGTLKVRPDDTIIDGHHRIQVLRERGVDVDALPREMLARD